MAVALLLYVVVGLFYTAAVTWNLASKIESLTQPRRRDEMTAKDLTMSLAQIEETTGIPLRSIQSRAGLASHLVNCHHQRPGGGGK